MANRALNEKLGAVDFPQLFHSNEVPAIIRGGVIAKGSAETTYKVGTLMEKDSNGKLSILGTASSGNNPDCVLAEEITVGKDADENVTVWISGDFNIDALIVKDEYEITEADRDTLRTKGILLGTVQNP